MTRNISGASACVALTGLGFRRNLHPGLTPWATERRPFGTRRATFAAGAEHRLERDTQLLTLLDCAREDSCGAVLGNALAHDSLSAVGAALYSPGRKPWVTGAK